MALKTFVKVGNVSNLSDARYCAGMEVDLLGFRFDQNGGTEPETFNEIRGWLSGVRYVAEFDTSSPNVILEVLSRCEVDFVQINNTDWIDELTSVSKLILEVTMDGLKALPAQLPLAYVVVRGDKEELTSQEKELIRKMSKRYKILLATGFSPENVEALLDELEIEGIAMRGSEEIRPGYKDYDELADILEILETDN